MRYKVTDKDKERILQRCKRGKNIYKLPELLGMHPGAIYHFLINNGYDEYLKREISSDEGRLIIKYRNEGDQVVHIGPRLLLYPHIVSMYLQDNKSKLNITTKTRKSNQGRKPTLLTEENKKEIIRIHVEEKVGLTAIAMFMHTNNNAIRQVLRDAGIEPIDYTLKPRVFTDEEREKIRELYDEGWCTENVAKELHSNAERIAKELKAMGYKLHAGRRMVLTEDVSDEDKERIIYLYTHYHRVDQIASWVDLPAETVKRLLKENNVERPGKITVDEMLANPEYEPMSFERFDELEFYKSQGIDVRKKWVEKWGKGREKSVEIGGNSTVDLSEFSDLETT